MFPTSHFSARRLGLLVALVFSGHALAMGLMVEPAGDRCAALQQNVATPTIVPPQAAKRLPDSQVAQGQRNIAWAWLGSPTRRYPHPALGSAEHAGSLHVLLRQTGGSASPFASGSTQGTYTAAKSAVATPIVLTLPLNRVYEDRLPRLVDLDGDGTDEILLIESDLLKGSALVVLGIRSVRVGGSEKQTLVELARGPFTGSTFRWLNPVGVADFDGDGRLDIASVTTPHIGGVLNLYHYRPQEPAGPTNRPGQLVAFANVMDVSNHKMGELEQEVAAIVTLPGQRPAIVVPDMTLTALHAFRWEAPGQWKELADLKPLPARIERLVATAQGACARLADQTWHHITLSR